MPYLNIQTNQPLTTEAEAKLLGAASRHVAEALGKSEQYVMVAVQASVPMRFAGSDEPTACLELKSIGLPEGDTPALSAGLCELIRQQLGIETERIYIEFTNVPRALWGWNGGTF
jgi:phenylpyruvate tautomerase PptA (4-oxalocrotonate tautomerase family)